MNNVKVALLSLLFIFFVFIGVSFGYSIENIQLCNILEFNGNQLIRINKNSNIDIYKGKLIKTKYNKKNLSFYINDFYVENNSYYLTLNRYISLENQITNLYIKENKESLFWFLFKNIF